MKIMHTGTVRSVCGSVVKIAVSVHEHAAGCSGCGLASSCGGAGKDTVTVDAECPEALLPLCREGCRVRVEARSASRLNATLFLLVIPLALFLLSLLIFTLAGTGELFTVAASLCITFLIVVEINRMRLNSMQTMWRVAEILN